MPEIFISYSRKDKEQVLKIVGKIEQSLGVKCWIDLEGIGSAEQFENVLVEAISQSKVVLFMMSKSSMKSKFVKKEISFAHNKGIRIVPIVLDQSQWADWFVYQFGDVNCIHYDQPDQMNILLRSLGEWCEVEGEVVPRTPLRTSDRKWVKTTIICGVVAAVLIIAVVLVAVLNRQVAQPAAEHPFVSKVSKAWVDTMETRMAHVLIHLDTNELDIDSLKVLHELDSLFSAKYTEVGEKTPAYNSALTHLREQCFSSWVTKGDKCVDYEVALECYDIALLIRDDSVVRNKRDSIVSNKIIQN